MSLSSNPLLAPKPYAAVLLYQMMLYMKFDHSQSNDIRDLILWKCEATTVNTAKTLLSYYLTWAEKWPIFFSFLNWATNVTTFQGSPPNSWHEFFILICQANLLLREVVEKISAKRLNTYVCDLNSFIMSRKSLYTCGWFPNWSLTWSR